VRRSLLNAFSDVEDGEKGFRAKIDFKNVKRQIAHYLSNFL
jgi:hypothetical protein